MEKDQAFSLLIDAELPMLRKVVWQILRNVADTDEVIQDALLKAWQSFNQYQARAKFSSWVYRIAVNTAYNLKRKRFKEMVALSHVHENDDFSASQEGNTLALKALDVALMELPEIYRQALVLTFIEDLPGERAAEIAGCTANTLYWRVSEAKKLLKKALSEVVYE